MKKLINILYDLLHVQEAKDNCDIDGSELCDHCHCTDYGLEKPYSSHPSLGFVSCEGSGCSEAEENLFEEIMGKFNNREGRLHMRDATMKLEIDLDVLQENLLKMSMDKIEDEVEGILLTRVGNNLEKSIEHKLDLLLREKMAQINVDDIFNIKIKIENNEISLFEYLTHSMINKVKQLTESFNKTVDELLDGVKYAKVDDQFDDNEFKVLTLLGTNSDNEIDSIEVQINGKCEYSIWEDEPEDMTFGRSLNDAFKVPELMKLAYLAGKSGQTMYMAEETEED